MLPSSVKNLHRAVLLYGFIVLSCLIVPSSTATARQSPQSGAIKWFQQALKEKSPAKKIEAYQKAISADPDFVEALYNLGLAYRSQKDDANAERLLYRAYSKVITAGRDKSEMKLRILYDLGLTYRRNRKMEDAQETLLAAKSLARDKKMRSSISFELARLYYSMGQYEKALIETEAGKQLNPEQAVFFENFSRTVEKTMRLTREYEQAEAAIARNDLQRATVLLRNIQAVNPEFRDVQVKLDQVEREARSRAEDAAYGTLYREAGRLESEGKTRLAIATYEEILAASPDYLDVREKVTALKSDLESQARATADREARLRSFYETGTRALAAEQWREAVRAFQSVRRIDPRYRSVRSRLAEAQRLLRAQTAAETADRLYADAVDALAQDEPGAALLALEKLEKLNPGYRNAAELMTRTRDRLESLASSAQEPRESGLAMQGSESRIDLLDSLYFEARENLAAGRRVPAMINLEKISLLDAGYRDVDSLIAVVRGQLAGPQEASDTKPAEESTGFMRPAVVAAAMLVILPVVGMLILMPTARAKYHLLRGQYTQAARIYERIIHRNPGRLKIYPALANLYLLLGQKDAQAMRVFKMVLQLNLQMPRRDEIRSLLAQNYLTESTDSEDAIEVLEHALKDEMRRSRE